MVACILTTLITSRLKRDSIYTLKLSRRGINLSQGREVNVLRSLKVESVMGTDYEQVYTNTPFRKLLDLTVKTPRDNFFVVNKKNNLLGVISVYDIRQIIYDSESLEQLLVAHDLLTPVKIFLTLDNTLDMAMKAFGDAKIDELPVLDKEKQGALIGTVSKNDVITAYNKEILKRDTVTSVSNSIGALKKNQQVDLMDGHILCELEVPGNFVNKTLKELNLRKKFGIEVILIKQGFNYEKKEEQHVKMPDPDYQLKFGDYILVMGEKKSIDKIQ